MFIVGEKSRNFRIENFDFTLKIRGFSYFPMSRPRIFVFMIVVPELPCTASSSVVAKLKYLHNK